jgi:hypothetical protein
VADGVGISGCLLRQALVGKPTERLRAHAHQSLAA